MRIQLLGFRVCCAALALAAPSACGADPSLGDEGSGGAPGLGGAGGAGGQYFLPPNHRSPLICDDGTLMVLPEGECVWAVCANEASGLEQRMGTCTPTGVGYLVLGCEDCSGFYANTGFYAVNEGPEEAYLLTSFPTDFMVAPVMFASEEVETQQCYPAIPPAGFPFPTVRAKFTLSDCGDDCDSHSLFALQAGQAVSCESTDDLSYMYEIVWVDYDDDGTPLGLRGSMEGISPLTVGRNCTDVGCPQVDVEGSTRFRIEFDIVVSCESDPVDRCVAE